MDFDVFSNSYNGEIMATIGTLLAWDIDCQTRVWKTMEDHFFSWDVACGEG